MVILGIGTNLGDRLSNLRQALALIKNIPSFSVLQISPVYMSDALLPDNAPEAWNQPFFNVALRCETQLSPKDLLHHTKKIEKYFESNKKKYWGPRLIDIDLLAWDDLILYDENLHIPHEHLHERPFALWPLADVAPRWCYPLPGRLQGKTACELVAPWGSRFTDSAPLHTKQILQRIDAPQWMGIINLTPDSFSSDGLLNNVSGAWQHLQHLVNTGAEILDFGAEATGPNAATLTPDEEWNRLAPLLKQTIAEKNTFLVSPKISVDTRHAVTAEKALALGADWINDVSGLKDPAMRELIKAKQCHTVFMHHLDIPTNKENHLPLNQDVASLVYQWAEQRLVELEEYGISSSHLIFDPGIGYGKTAEQSLEIIKNISAFHKLGVRILVGHSRKSFLTQFTTQPAANRDFETTLVSQQLAHHAVDYIRVHNVELNAQGLRIMKEFNFSYR